LTSFEFSFKTSNYFEPIKIEFGLVKPSINYALDFFLVIVRIECEAIRSKPSHNQSNIKMMKKKISYKKTCCGIIIVIHTILGLH
jgi:hypothetical protein